MATEKWTAGTSRTSGISEAAITAGANYLGSEIDNSTNKDKYLSVDLAFTCGSAPTANTIVELYILYSINGTDYEDGGVSVDPKKLYACQPFAARAVTTEQRGTRVNIPIAPFKFKILLKSDLNQNISLATLLAFTHDNEIA